MSLFSALQLGNNALRVQQIGIQVTGQNIANANTPGYIREEVIQTPAPTQRFGGLLLGMGVQVDAITQRVDKFLEERLRGAVSDRAGAEIQEEAYRQLEAVVGELSDTDLSTTLNNFFASINEVLNQPESVAVRNLAVLKGRTLTDDIRRLYQRVGAIRSENDQQLGEFADNINRLTKTIATLNIRVAEAEGGTTVKSDAVGLRDQRQQALTELAELVDIRTEEQDDGTVTIFVGGDYLVFQGQARPIEAKVTQDAGLNTTTLRIVDTNSELEFAGGKVAGQVVARDGILLDYMNRLAEFTKTFTYEFNKVFSSGQGLSGYQNITSEFHVDDAQAPLDEAGLPFTPVNGSFQVLVYNENTKLSRTTNITVDLNGLDDDTSLESLAQQLDAIDGLAASVTPTGKLKLATEASDSEFAFKGDTSGVLAALGVATFFSGSGPSDLGVNQQLVAVPGRFAASTQGFGAGTDNAVILAQFQDRALDSAGGASVAVLYDRLVGETTQGAGVSGSVAEGFRVFEDTLRGQQLGLSGVSLDEEAVRLIEYQRVFQATARYIGAVSDLLEVLVRL